jgi:hypothetical protein
MCAICGGTDKPVVDFGTDIEYVGAFYMCKECTSEAASMFGCASEKETSDLRGQVKHLTNELLTREEVKSYVDDISSSISGFREWLVSHGTLPNNTEPTLAAVVREPEPVIKPSTKSVVSKRPTNVPSTTVDDLLA